MVKISVIVPAYNVEKYISGCLVSLVNQTFREFEIIVINDGSTDNTADIINSFKKQSKNIILINTSNQGLSAARNLGIYNAKGEYIAFIDSDDWIDKNFLENLYSASINTNSDIACANIIKSKNNVHRMLIKYEKFDTYKSLDEKIHACGIPNYCYVWNKLYKRTLILL